MNAMIYIRGSRHDYDDWAKAGATGWSYDEVLPYFNSVGEQRAWRGQLPRQRRAVERLGSPIAERPVLRHGRSRRRTGINGKDDFNGAIQEGAGIYQVTQKGGVRCSTADGFLDPVRDRANLTVLGETMARVLPDEEQSGNKNGLGRAHGMRDFKLLPDR